MADQTQEPRPRQYHETTDQAIINNLAYHSPTEKAKTLHGQVRYGATSVSLWLNDNLPECDEKKEALKAVRQAMMWANAAIACHGDEL